MAMNRNQELAEVVQRVVAAPIVDMSTAGITGAWVSLKNYPLAEIVLITAAGTAGDDPTITVQQATDVSGTGAKALTFERIYHKQGAAIEAVAQYTLVTQTAANTYTDATSAEVETEWRIPIRAADLDVANGFDCIRATVADVGTNAQLGVLFYDLAGRYAGHALPSALA